MIVAAAVKALDGTVYALPAPARHGNVFNLMSRLGLPSSKDCGFIDSEEGFVDRSRAFEIAMQNDQNLGRFPQHIKAKLLFSEDVWDDDLPELVRLRAALKPFAEQAYLVDEDDYRDGDHLWESAAAMSLEAGDLRRAREALSPTSLPETVTDQLPGLEKIGGGE